MKKLWSRKDRKLKIGPGAEKKLKPDLEAVERTKAIENMVVVRMYVDFGRLTQGGGKYPTFAGQCPGTSEASLG